MTHGLRKMLSLYSAVVGLWYTSVALGSPISATFFNDGRCDLITDQPLTHQLGQAPAFPIDERVLLISIVSNAEPVCIGSDPDLADNFQVTIRNESPTAWKDLFLVARTGVTFGNADGSVVVPYEILPGRDAFRIDSVGVNANLMSESLNPDNIFEPNEVWTFVVTDYSASGMGPPTFSSLGLDSGSDPAFLLGNPVPIPATVWLLVSGLMSLLGLRGLKR